MASEFRKSKLRFAAWGALLLALVSFVPPRAHASAYTEPQLFALESSDETQLRQLRDQEVNQLRIALGRRSPSNRRADLYLRLAEIYLESYRAMFMLEGRLHEKKLEAGKKDPILDRAHSKYYLFQGIKACREILSFNIPYEKLDEVYYFLAFNYGELGDHQQSIGYFGKLTRDFPDSPMVSEGYRQLGESAYAQRDFKKAQQFFEMAARKAPADSLAMTLHKLAWCFYRQRNYDRAVDVMKQAIQASSQNSEKFLNLREEALRDMAVFMTESDHADEAMDYFKKVAGEKNFYPKLLEKLGREYERNVEPAKATQVYEALLKTNPDDQTRFRVMVKLVDLDLRRARFMAALVRVKQISEPGGGDAETQVAAQNLRAMVRRTATENHEHYRKNQTRASLEVAEAFYEDYLNQFLKKNDPRHEIPEIQMYLAEVKRDLGKPGEASDLYRQVVDSKDERYAKEAGSLWTASLSDAIRKSGTAKGASVKATEPSALEKEYIEAADRLQDALGDTSDGRSAALKAAEVEAGYKSTQDSAIKRIKNLIKQAPKSQQALTGARLWLQIYADQLATDPGVASDLKDTIDDLRGNAELISADQEIGSGKLKALLNDQEIRLKVTAIAKNEKNKDFSDAAKGYEDFAKDAPNRDLAEKAYANAIVNYSKSQDIASVDRVSDAWLKRYPGSSKALDSLRAVASQFLIQGNFEAAAAEFRKAGETGQDQSSLETAARLSAGIGNAQAQQEDLQLVLEKYRKSDARPRIVLELAKSYEAQRDDSNAAKYYKMCHEIPELAAECGARLADLYLKGEDADQAKAMYKKVAAIGGKKKEGSPWIGYARYQLAQQMEKNAHFDPLVLPEATLKKAMDQRTSFLEPLSRAYNSAVEAGGPWAIASLDALATWVYNFASDIDQIAPPNNKPEVVARFQKGLKGLSDPLRKKAIATWADAYSKAASAESYSPVLPDIADHLADSRAIAPHRAQGVRSKLRLSGLSSDGGPDGKDAALAKVREKLTKNQQDAQSWIDYGNLMWGAGKPVLAKLMYEYALSLQPKSASAMNNRGVLLLNEGEEDWTNAYEAAQYFRNALKKDEFFLPAKMNLASLMNYYRLFAKAKPFWQQVSAKVQSSDVEDGLATALQGLGDVAGAEAGFKKATEMGANEGRFAWLYHEAARQSFDSAQAALAGEKCLGTLNGVSESVLSGFERSAMASLKRACTQWSQK